MAAAANSAAHAKRSARTPARSAGMKGVVVFRDGDIDTARHPKRSFNSELPEQTQHRPGNVDDVLQPEGLRRSGSARLRHQADFHVGLAGPKQADEQFGDE